ncbi:hypothetical protein COCNU_08G000190 [Cocos nucifera]|uniref:Uncharacterized protein n=1 Tax=Cocos nucifera TaxID=13894 RepID=A0A8K0N575_COCNU|nr:hypothetical protein COCNU_08G000190 [Cocos nucifera]
MEQFKTSPEMKDLNIAFSQETFIKDFELYEGRVARRFFELDLSFQKEKEEAGNKVGPSSTWTNLSSVEPTVEVPEPAESIPTSPAATPPEVMDLE